jgi:hypothetical protein
VDVELVGLLFCKILRWAQTVFVKQLLESFFVLAHIKFLILPCPALIV